MPDPIASPIPRLQVRVAAIASEAPAIRCSVLVDPTGMKLPPFTAGAHILVDLSNGLTRQYSLCNDPVETHRYRIAVLREHNGRGGSAWMQMIGLGRRHAGDQRAAKQFRARRGRGVLPVDRRRYRRNAGARDVPRSPQTRAAFPIALLHAHAGNDRVPRRAGGQRVRRACHPPSRWRRPGQGARRPDPARDGTGGCARLLLRADRVDAGGGAGSRALACGPHPFRGLCGNGRCPRRPRRWATGNSRWSSPAPARR